VTGWLRPNHATVLTKKKGKGKEKRNERAKRGNNAAKKVRSEKRTRDEKKERKRAMRDGYPEGLKRKS
jgi:hypothetical protein